MPAKITNEIADQRLIGRNILRLEDISGVHVKIKWKCLVKNCNFEWMTTPYSIFKGCGCHRCGNVERITNDTLDSLLLGRNIIRLEDYTNNKTKMKFKCVKLDCGYEWLNSTNSILSNRGCPRCSKRERITNEVIDKRLIDSGKNLIRLEDSYGATTKIKFGCTVEGCGYEWKITPSDIFNNNIKCCRCTKTEKITNEIIDFRLKNIPIIRLEDCKNSYSKIKWRCSKCNFEWYASPKSITICKYGCPSCKKKNENRIYNFLCVTYGKNNIISQKYLNINNKKCYIDFVVKNVFIEYHGQQHYEPIQHFGGITKFIKQQLRDEELRKYCEKFNIKLIEIPYWLSHEEQYKLIIENIEG